MKNSMDCFYYRNIFRW